MTDRQIIADLDRMRTENQAAGMAETRSDRAPVDVAEGVRLIKRELRELGLYQVRPDRFTLIPQQAVRVQDWYLEVGTSYHEIRIRVVFASEDGEHHTSPLRRREERDINWDDQVSRGSEIWGWLTRMVSQGRNSLTVADNERRITTRIRGRDDLVIQEYDNETGRKDWP